MPLPKLKDVAGSDEDRTRAKTKFSTIDEIEKKLARMGFSVQEEPPTEPMPRVTAEHLTTTNSREYTTMYAHQLAWLNYAGPLLAKIRATLLEINAAMTQIETTIRKDIRARQADLSRSEKLTEQDIADRVWLDPDYQEMVIQKQKNDQQRMILEKIVEGMEQNMKVISRQVELRKIELGGIPTETNLPARGRSPFTRNT